MELLSGFNELYFEELFKENIQIAKFLYFLICFLQPIMLPLPEAVTVIAGSSVFGSFSGFILGFSGTILGIYTMFTLTGNYGLNVVKKFIKEKSLVQYHTFVQKGEVFILVLLFIIPILPDEVICIGAALSGVTKKRFFIIAAFSKLITSFSLAYSLMVAEYLNLSSTEFVIIITSVLLLIYLLSIMIKKYFGHKKNEKHNKTP